MVVLVNWLAGQEYNDLCRLDRGPYGGSMSFNGRMPSSGVKRSGVWCHAALCGTRWWKLHSSTASIAC